MKCIICGKDLTGALDTFGDPGHEMCFDHYFNSPSDDPLIEAEQQDYIDGLEDMIAGLQDELDEIDDGVLSEDAAGLLEMKLTSDLQEKIALLKEAHRSRREAKRRVAQAKQARIDAWKRQVGHI
jgi:Mg2+ and Co2+ transporter CorA